MMMIARCCLALLGAFAVVASSVSAAAMQPGVTVLYHGRCVVSEGVKSTWDVTQEIFQTGSPTWLPAHLHAGAECIMNVQGITAWWTAAAKPGAPATPFPVGGGKTLYVPEGQVHTAGNPGPSVPPYVATQAYMGIHVLIHGTAFNYPVDYPSAPGPVRKTAPVSIFKNTFTDQPSVRGPFTIANQVLQLAPGAVYTIPASPARGYYTVVTGSAISRRGPLIIRMVPKQTMIVPSGVSTFIRATAPTMLAATELIPGTQD
jgi:mannose-6-phosphate isomerase-like protein (cupin superfamily)